MHTEDINPENVSAEIPQRAVSLYGQGEGVDDFPVLKAFQQYIDAEQEKARKRIIGLGIFFGAVLVVVIAVFMVLLHGINTRNQALSDRLVEYAMKESERHPVAAPVVQPVQQNDAALKAITETLVTMQKKMQESEAKPAAQPLVLDPRHEQKVREDTAKIEREKLKLEAERKRLAEEKERLHQIEIDRQRRKLYPELYEDEDAGASGYRPRKSNTRTKTRTLTDEDIREIIREAYPETTEEKKPSPPPVREEKAKKTEPEESAEQSEAIEPDDAIEYFKDDNYTIPVDVKGTSSKVKFTVPVD